ncbi:Transmembrane and coiled-coil domains-containing protein 3 [Datura stramonium]|uniref:Transmembrane and coiled-coil domains-containing protein 3 n=1 Tax=Datura stramonium TaxID=4076 RepID=A0ABS8RP56_DATST|nr:Transmembrane and coiled-coil domains-containing protein 3 [Datura stramonium]
MPMPGLCFLLLSFRFFVLLSSADQIPGDPENAVVVNAAEFNSSSIARSEEGSFANMIDRALEKEFNETEEQPGVRRVSGNTNLTMEQCGRWIKASGYASDPGKGKGGSFGLIIY